jgi:DNA-binding transcriptional LysR family regulator
LVVWQCFDVRINVIGRRSLRELNHRDGFLVFQIGSSVNLLDTQIALVEAEEGIAIISSFGMPACRNRKIVMSQLINPVVRFDFHIISRRGRELPPGADEFTSFLKSYIAT